VAKKRLSAAKKFLDKIKEKPFSMKCSALYGDSSATGSRFLFGADERKCHSGISCKKCFRRINTAFYRALDACELARFAPGIASSIEDIYKKGIDVISKLRRR